MKKTIIVVTLILLVLHAKAYSESDSIANIKNFSLLSESLASSAMPTESEFELIRRNDYQHIINLIPGDFSQEKKRINALGMSFEQIAVDWNQPTLSDFQHFVNLMKAYQHEKVLVHCRLNYRASVFTYLYQTTQLGIDEAIARRQLLDIWQPNDTWLEFIDNVHKNYVNPK